MCVRRGQHEDEEDKREEVGGRLPLHEAMLHPGSELSGTELTSLDEQVGTSALSTGGGRKKAAKEMGRAAEARRREIGSSATLID